MAKLDHIVVAAKTLEQGVQYVEDLLEVKMPMLGGKHPLMGTHNRLMNLGGGAYLEVIAIDPDAPPPGRARWFDLDGFSGEPRLLTWVARVENLEAHSALKLGNVQKASRGNLEWLIAIPDDGCLHRDGAVPYLIQWGSVHPTDSMPDSGCALVELVTFHPEPESVLTVLNELQIKGIRVEKAEHARLEAQIQTPSGLKILI